MIQIGNKKITGIYIKVDKEIKRLLLKKKKENQIRDFIIYTIQKALEYQFNETTSSNRSNTFTLDDLISIDEITVDNGSVTYSIDGNKVTVSVSDGNSRSEYDSTKYSKLASDYKTSSTDSFPSSMNYSSDEYSGTLSKDGNSYVSSGNYIPSDSKTVTDYQTSSTDNFVSNIDYNSGGYKGTLNKNGSSFVTSGSYIPSESKVVQQTSKSSYGSFNDELFYNKDGFTGYIQKNGDMNVVSGGYHPGGPRDATLDLRRYGTYENGEFTSDSSFKGTFNQYQHHQEWENPPGLGVSVIWYGDLKLDYVESYTIELLDRIKREKLSGKSFFDAHYSGVITAKPVDTRVWEQKYSGTVTKPSVDTRQWRQDYKGTVYKPSSDTRIWKQNYKGYIYKGGYNNYYKYKINMKYTIKN